MIGGSNTGNVVRNIMRRVMEKNVAKQLSWYGRRGNTELSKTKLGETILRTFV